MLKHIIDSSRTLLHQVSSWLHSSFDFSKESIFPVPTSQQAMELTEEANQHYRNIADYNKEVLPIWQLLLDLDMETFAQKFSDQWHKPYKHLGRIAVWDKRNRYRYVRCLHAAKTIRSGYEDIQWHRKRRYDTIVRNIEKDLAALSDSSQRHFWAKQLLSASMALKRETGLFYAQQGSNVVTPQGMYWQSNISEWQKNNIIVRIKEFKGGRFAWYNDPAWVQIGHLWADIDRFQLAWAKFSGFENTTPNDSQTDVAIANLKRKVGRQPKEAELIGISIGEVSAIFNTVKVGVLYNQPGEWAAALVALKVNGYLVGAPPEIDRWLVKAQFKGRGSNSLLETLKKKKDLIAYEQFKGSEASVFKKVKEQLELLEKSKEK